MDPKQLAERIRATLQAELGTLPNGAPAVWVDESDVPAGRSSGLQVVIQPVPEIRNFTWTTGRIAHMDAYLVVDLIQFDRSKSLAIPLEKMRSAFQISSEVRTPRTQQTFERATLKLFSPRFTR